MPKKQVTFNDDTDVYIGASTVDSYREVHEEAVAPKEVQVYNIVKLVNQIGAAVKMQGSVTGKHYLWSRSGAVVEVDERDAPALLEKRLGDRACCGSANKNYVFAIVD